jgi:ribose transport system substrate-binding protein
MRRSITVDRTGAARGEDIGMDRRAFVKSGLGAAGLLLSGCTPQPDAGTGTTTTNSPSGSGSSGGKRFLIGMSQANKGEPWRQAMNDQIQAAVDKHPELEVVFADAAQDNSKQIANVENFITQSVDLLIISPNEAEPLTDPVAKAYDKGIPVIVLDRKVNGDKYTMWIGANNEKIGERAGEYVAKWAAEQKLKACPVIELRGLAGSTPARERGDGFRKGIATNPAVEIVAEQDAKWLREKAIPASQSMLQGHPDAAVIYGHNDPMAEAAIISATEKKLDLDKILVVGIDALPTPDGGIKSVLEGRIDVTYVYPTGGAEAIDWALKILNDKATPPKEVVLETEEVTSANAAEVLAKYGGG